MDTDDYNDDDFPTEEYSTGFENRGKRVKTGDEILMTKIDPTLRHLMVGIGWDLKPFEGDPLDLDASVFLLNKDDLTREDTDFIYYNNLSGCNDSVKHTGDNKTGAGEGDDETISVQLDMLPYDIQKLVFVISIYQGDEKEQDFSMVRNCFLRLVNEEDNRELIYYELSEKEFKTGTGIVVAEYIREGPEWSFFAKGEVYEKGLVDIATNYGMVVGQY